MVVTLWAIWHARWKSIYEHVFQPSMSTHMFIMCFIAEVEALAPALSATRPPKPASQPWIRPPPGIAKCNVDGTTSVHGDRGAVAVVCRNEYGKYLGSSSIFWAGISDPTIFEALAVREVLATADDLMLKRILVSLDCLQIM